MPGTWVSIRRTTDDAYCEFFISDRTKQIEADDPGRMTQYDEATQSFMDMLRREGLLT